MHTFTDSAQNGHWPTVTEVDRIANLADPVLRNLQITQCYHELSLIIASRTGTCANWCTFATWASKQAGQTIRKEDMLRALERLLATQSNTEQTTNNLVPFAQTIDWKRDPDEIRQMVWAALNPLSALDRASGAVARGNLKVFAEIGREFARFADACLNDETFDGDHLARFSLDLRPGDPPAGQRLLRQAFARYYQAFFESDAKVRAELMLLADLEIGLHEQMRLQPEIAKALEAGLINPHQFALRLLHTLFPKRGWAIYLVILFRRLLRQPLPLDLAIRRLYTEAQKQIRSLITQHMMVLTLPHDVWLRLGEDLRAKFPAVLVQIASADLLALLKEIDPTPDSLAETGAVDWSNLAERIHFIADLFRCYLVTTDLFDPPFTPDQVSNLKAGRIPLGPL